MVIDKLVAIEIVEEGGLSLFVLRAQGYMKEPFFAGLHASMLLLHVYEKELVMLLLIMFMRPSFESGATGGVG